MLPWTVPPITRAFLYLLASLIGIMPLWSCTTYHNQGPSGRPELHPSQKVIDTFLPASTYRYVVPYEVNLYSIHILRKNLNWRDIEQYIIWYFSHLNYPDKHGLTGSMYDYALDENGVETSTETYDSVDAYAATFMILLKAYYQKVGKRDLLDYYHKEIKDIAYLMIYLGDDDALTRAVSYYDAKYLMDNCEVYAGLKAYVDLAKALGWRIPNTYHAAIDKIKLGIRSKFYDPFNGMFHWALSGNVAHQSQWDRFYPDALAQLFPILYDIIDPASPKARRIWDTFHSEYGMGEGIADHLQSLLISTAQERLCSPETSTINDASSLDLLQ